MTDTKNPPASDSPSASPDPYTQALYLEAVIRAVEHLAHDRPATHDPTPALIDIALERAEKLRATLDGLERKAPA